MKISCQACHSKYNVADEKVQGKIVKIRCRKCGATIIVNGNIGVAGNGSEQAETSTAMGTEPSVIGAAGERLSAGAAVDEWHVSITDNDQRTMSLAELANAFDTGVVAQDTFVWTDGMQDWKPVGEVDAVMAVLRARSGKARTAGVEAPHSVAGPEEASSFTDEATVALGAGYRPPLGAHRSGIPAQAVTEPAVAAQEPKRAAVVRREARARDLFATRTGEELQATAQSIGDSRLTGQRNETSVLFSLDHLTKNSNAEARPEQRPGGVNHDDSGVIDLNALAAKAESMRPPRADDPYALAPPLGFTSPLFGAPIGGAGQLGSDTRRSKLPLLIGAGAAGIALLLVLGVVIGLKLGGGNAPATAPPLLPAPSIATAEPAPSPPPVAAPPASVSGSAAPSAVATAKPHGYGTAPARATTGAAKPGNAGGSAPATGGTGGAATPPPPPATKKNDCGCNGDLMCLMKCSTH